MSASPHDLRDYLFDELSEAERSEVEAYLKTSPEARDELEQLRVTQQVLLSVPDEEIPRRIAFVSDKVFEPSRARRWWLGFWDVAPRLGFSMATVMLVLFAGIWMVEPTVTVDAEGWRVAFGEAPQPQSVSGPVLDEDEIARLVREVASEQAEIQSATLKAFLEGHLASEAAARKVQYEETMRASDEVFRYLMSRYEDLRREVTFSETASLER